MGGDMLILFGLMVVMSVFVRVSVRFLGLYRLFRGLRCGVLFLLCSPLVQSILVLTI